MRLESHTQAHLVVLRRCWSASRFFYSHRPFDIVKVRIQTAPPGYYSGVVSCIRDIFKKGGFAGFYKGTELPLIGVGACVSIQFGVVQYFKRLFQNMNAKQHGKQSLHLTHSQLYLSGLAGGVTNSVLAAPIEHVRIRLQTQQTPLYSGPVDCMKQYVEHSSFQIGSKGRYHRSLSRNCSHGAA